MEDDWDRALEFAFGGDEGPPGPGKGVVLGDFRLVREIGRGGMGVVFEARQLSLDRTVALKLLPYHAFFDEKGRARFQREAALTARLKHPGIVEIYTVGRENGADYYAMEFVTGAPLDRLISEEGRGDFGSAVTAGCHRPAGTPPPDPPDPSPWARPHLDIALDLAVQVADALHHAHEQGVVHRDVKPANILVREDGTAVLTDFGLARGDGAATLTRTHHFVGTPQYLAPECLGEEPSPGDARRDVYALGVTLYEMLTLTRPHDEMPSEPPDPRRLNPAVSRELAAVVRKAMERDPDRRYPTAAALAADLRACREGRSVSVRPDSVVTRSIRVVRRRRRALVFALVWLVVGVAVAAVSLRPEPNGGGEAAYWRSAELAAGALADGHPETARRHLEDCAEEYRGWEWNHLRLAAELALDPPPDASEEGAALTLPLSGETHRSVALSPDGRRIASANWWGRIRIWDAETGEVRRTARAEWLGECGLAFTPDGKRILTCADLELGSWDLTTDSLRGLAYVEGNGRGLDIHPDGRRAAACWNDGTVVLCDLDSGEIVASWRREARPNSLLFGPDGTLYLGDVHGGIWIVDPETGEKKGELKGHMSQVTALALHPDGRILYSGSQDGTVRRWELDSGRCTHAVQLDRWVHRVAVSPDGSRVACGYFEIDPKGTLCASFSVRSAANPSLGVAIRSRDGRVNGVRFSGDGERLFIGTAFGGVRVYCSTLAAARSFWPVLNRYRRGEEAEAVAREAAFQKGIEMYWEWLRVPLPDRIAHCRKVCELLGGPRAHRNLGITLYESGKYREALATFAQAEALNSECGISYYPGQVQAYRALCHLRLGETEAARAILDGIGPNPPDVNTRNLLKEAEAVLGAKAD